MFCPTETSVLLSQHRHSIKMEAMCYISSNKYGQLAARPIFAKLARMRRQCGPVVRALALRSGDPGFKTRSDHSLNLFLVVPGSTSQLHL